MSSGSENKPPQADEQMRAATEKLRQLAWTPPEVIDLTAEAEAIDLTPELEPTDTNADT